MRALSIAFENSSGFRRDKLGLRARAKSAITRDVNGSLLHGGFQVNSQNATFKTPLKPPP